MTIHGRTNDDDEAHDGRQSPATRTEYLRRGHGLGAISALREREDPETAEAVYSCIAQDHRWDWQVDGRAVYLARLVRDLRLDADPLIEQLWRTGRDPDDPDNAFSHVVGVLEDLGRIGYADVVEQVRRYIREGDQGLAVLARVAAVWPAGLWDDLDDAVLDRFPDGDPARSAARSASGGGGPRRPFAGRAGDELVGLLADSAVPVWTKTLALRELARRPPEPGLLGLVERLHAEVEPPRVLPGLVPAVRAQGEQALELARIWADDERPALAWIGVSILAEVGDESDLPRLMAELRAMAESGAVCPYDRIVDGLARFGPPAAGAVPVITTLWFETPHSFERASYLAALTAIDPDGAAPLLEQGLFDCEADVRLFAVRSVRRGPESGTVDRTLASLRDDPLETDELRAAAAARLAR